MNLVRKMLSEEMKSWWRDREDGEFFWHEDQKLQGEPFAKLANVTFHEKLVLFQNTWRVGVIARH